MGRYARQIPAGKISPPDLPWKKYFLAHQSLLHIPEKITQPALAYEEQQRSRAAIFT